MLRKARLALLAASMVVALVAAGCGSSNNGNSTSTAAITKAVFLAKSNAICTRGNRAATAAATKKFGNQTADPGTICELRGDDIRTQHPESDRSDSGAGCTAGRPGDGDEDPRHGPSGPEQVKRSRSTGWQQCVRRLQDTGPALRAHHLRVWRLDADGHVYVDDASHVACEDRSDGGRGAKAQSLHHLAGWRQSAQRAAASDLPLASASRVRSPHHHRLQDRETRRRCLRAIRRGNKVYVVAIKGAGTTAWAKNALANSDVRLRLSGGTFSGCAHELRVATESEQAKEAYCDSVHRSDHLTWINWRKGHPTPARIRELLRGWFEKERPWWWSWTHSRPGARRSHRLRMGRVSRRDGRVSR